MAIENNVDNINNVNEVIKENALHEIDNIITKLNETMLEKKKRL